MRRDGKAEGERQMPDYENLGVAQCITDVEWETYCKYPTETHWLNYVVAREHEKKLMLIAQYDEPNSDEGLEETFRQ